MSRLGILGGMVILAGALWLLWPHTEWGTISIGGREFVVEIVRTPRALERGLSGRDMLPSGQGMLFALPKPDYHGVWMKDMRFPLDILWLDEDEQVVSVVRNAKPDSYPTIFTPPVPAASVLEINAGEAPDVPARI